MLIHSEVRSSLHAGVSNFDIVTLRELLQMARIQPSVVQSNSDILSPNKDLLEFCATAGIQFQVLLCSLVVNNGKHA